MAEIYAVLTPDRFSRAHTHMTELSLEEANNRQSTPMPQLPEGDSQESIQTALARVEGVMSQLLEAQRMCRLEVESRWADLEAHGQKLKVELACLRASAGEPKQEEAAEADGENCGGQPGNAVASWLTTEKRHSNGHGHDVSPAEEAAMAVAEAEEGVVASTTEEGVGWVRYVKSPRFDMLVGCVILVNVLVMSLQVQYDGYIVESSHFCHEGMDCSLIDHLSSLKKSAETFFYVFEVIFALLFTGELIARLLANGLGYLRSNMNKGDAIIVIVGNVDAFLLTPLTDGGGATSQVSLLRVARLVRLVKVLRVMRVMKAFKPLRVLVSSVANSIPALGWSMTLLFVLELMGAIFLAQVLRPAIQDPDRLWTSREWLFNRFGTLTRSLLTVFEVTMAPGGFLQYRVLYDDVHPVFGLLICLYVVVVTFAIVRVITAMFLKETLSASDSESRLMAFEMANQREAYARKICSTLDQHMGVEDGHGRISRSGLMKLLNLGRMREWLDDIDLDEADALRLFKALETGDNAVHLRDYISALLQMSERPGNRDVIIHHETRSILERIMRLESVMQAHGSRSSLDVPTLTI